MVRVPDGSGSRWFRFPMVPVPDGSGSRWFRFLMVPVPDGSGSWVLLPSSVGQLHITHEHANERDGNCRERERGTLGTRTQGTRTQGTRTQGTRTLRNLEEPEPLGIGTLGTP